MRPVCLAGCMLMCIEYLIIAGCGGGRGPGVVRMLTFVAHEQHEGSISRPSRAEYQSPRRILHRSLCSQQSPMIHGKRDSSLHPARYYTQQNSCISCENLRTKTFECNYIRVSRYGFYSNGKPCSAFPSLSPQRFRNRRRHVRTHCLFRLKPSVLTVLVYVGEIFAALFHNFCETWKKKLDTDILNDPSPRLHL